MVKKQGNLASIKSYGICNVPTAIKENYMQSVIMNADTAAMNADTHTHGEPNGPLADRVPKTQKKTSSGSSAFVSSLVLSVRCVRGFISISSVCSAGGLALHVDGGHFVRSSGLLV